MHNIPNIKDEHLNQQLWQCILKCLERFKCWTNQSKWNKLDDIFESLLQRIAFESNVQINMNLIGILTKIASLPIHDEFIVKAALDLREYKETFDYVAFRERCRNYNSHLTFRWINKILQIFIHQQSTIFWGMPKQILFNIQVNHCLNFIF